MCIAGIRPKDNVDATQKKASFARHEASPGSCPSGSLVEDPDVPDCDGRL